MVTRATNRSFRGLWLAVVLVGLLALVATAALAQDAGRDDDPGRRPGLLADRGLIPDVMGQRRQAAGAVPPAA